jgi:lysophospholipase L1-like esterase
MGTRALTIYSRLMIGLGLLFATALFVFNLLHLSAYGGGWAFLLTRFAIPPLAAFGFGRAMFSRLDTRIAVANTVLAAIIALYAGDYLIGRRRAAVLAAAARRAGMAMDWRNKLTVIQDLRRNGIDAYPVTQAPNLLSADASGKLRPVLSAHGEMLLPMASAPDTTVVGCNELGQWQIYKTDRHGFTNPDNQWDDPHPAIGMVGDSFTQGNCVLPGRNIAAYLRARFGTTLDLGVSGFGPLLELATLTEYLEHARPRIVLWLFYEGNDLNEDLPHEARAPLLRRYLDDPRFSQDLIHRAGAIRGALRRYLDSDLAATTARMDFAWVRLLKLATLDRLREAVGLGALQIGYNAGDMQAELALFARIMRAARGRVHGWGGTLYLVYIPESDRYLSRFGDSAMRKDISDGVRRVARQQGISLIDLAAAFARQPDPGSLYSYPGGHFNVAGYRLAAEVIARALEREKALPPQVPAPAGREEARNSAG